MARRFEADYRVDSATQVLRSENAFRQDIDLRLDRLEQRDSVIDTAAREVVDRAVRFVEQEVAPIAADLMELRDDIPAAITAARQQVDGFVAAADQQVDAAVAAAQYDVGAAVTAAQQQVGAFVASAQAQVDELIAGGIDDGIF